MRVRERPRFKVSCGVAFKDFGHAAAAVRELSQSGLNPANCRLLDRLEAQTTGAGDGEHELLVLGFESAHHPVDRPMATAIDVARSHGGVPGEVHSTKAASQKAETTATADSESGRLGVQLALGLPRRALHPRHVRRLRRPLGDLRDRDHLGPLRRLPRGGDGHGPREGRRGLRHARRRARARRASAAASPTSTPTGPLPTSRSSRPPSAAARSSSGTRSRPPRRRP